MAKNIREKTADTILQTPTSVKVGKKEYSIAPPKCDTLLEASKRIPLVPFVDVNGDIINEALAAAKDSRPLFEIVAVLILGAKEAYKVTKRHFWPFGKRRTKLDELTDELISECSPSEVVRILAVALSGMEVKDFFEFTASLQEISLIQMTREAEITASGQ